MNPTSFSHALSLSDRVGIFEHAKFATPRREHGYCTDDVARLSIVTVREPEPRAHVRELSRIAFRFLSESQSATGRTRNRRDADGQWTDRHGTEDCWGRSLWAFGTAARRAPETSTRALGILCFERGAVQRSPDVRAMVFAALGAAEVAEQIHGHHAARHQTSSARSRCSGASLSRDARTSEARSTASHHARPQGPQRCWSLAKRSATACARSRSSEGGASAQPRVEISGRA